MDKKQILRKRAALKSLLDIPEVKSWRALMTAFKVILSELEKNLTHEGCSVSRFQILFFLYFEGNLPAAEIARKLLVTRGNISMFLRRMEADLLIKKVIPPEQKRPLYTLTKNGTDFFEKLFPSHIKRVKQLAPRLDEKTIKLLLNV